MNKAELAAEVATRLDGVDADARRYVDAVFDVIMQRVTAGERVQILGFGTFDSVERAARTGRNPRTGAAIQVPASTSPRFHAGQTFRTQVSDARVTAEPAKAEAPKGKSAKSKDVAKPEKAKKAKAAEKKVVKTSKAAKTEKAVKTKKAAKPAKAAKSSKTAKTKAGKK